MKTGITILLLTVLASRAYTAGILEPFGKMSGTVLLRDDDLRAAHPSLKADADSIQMRYVDVRGMPFEQALEIETFLTPKYTYDMTLAIKTPKPIQKDDVLFLRLWFQCMENKNDIGEGILSVELRNDGKDRSLGTEFTAGTEWKACYVSGKARKNYAAGEAMLRLTVGYRPQKIRIGGMELHNLENNVTLEELPAMPLSYAGMEPNAPWRRAAAERIELHRKSDIAVKVVDSKGASVNNAEVSVTLKRHAFGFGGPYAALLHVDESFRDELPVFQQHFKECFNKAVLPNALKWKQYAEKGTTWAPQAYDWLTENGYAVRGHNLIWPGWNFMPAWVREHENDPDKLRALTRERMEEVMKTWSGKLAEWDVTNEPWRQDALMKICGWDLFLDWYRWARELDPDTKLYYNDANTLVNNQPGHQDHYFKTIQWMLAEGAPIDGMGFESHVHQFVPPEVIYERIDRFAKLGPDIQITEFDIGHASASDEFIARYARDFMTIVFSHPKPIGIITWLGGNPLRATSEYHPSRRDQAAFYDIDWTPTPLGQAWLDLKNREWRTDVSGETNRKGVFETRGFHGEYTVTVRANGKEKTVPVTVGKKSAAVKVEL